ncbi:hypothetical protein I2I05_11355 [Hymenobacter sp. BT683]|uniref:YcxB family protein n=1 Tax=Hymenobacter jeongseonensis TaxID=2791027 RepID=A0ABS0II21_9BACT|nr:hypothetical protein [Hymenobacter jeongseonensis]MBF9237991.1 hypothetical protein [Hymenobacter jeongseonensis]
MLTIQSSDTVGSLLTKRALLLGAVFLALTFLFHKYSAVLLSCYVVAFILMFISVAGRRRVTKLKIQAKRLDVYFGGFWKTEIKSFQLTELKGRFLNAKAFWGEQYSILEIEQNGTPIFAVETREGFEEAKLKTLFSLINWVE